MLEGGRNVLRRNDKDTFPFHGGETLKEIGNLLAGTRLGRDEQDALKTRSKTLVHSFHFVLGRSRDRDLKGNSPLVALEPYIDTARSVRGLDRGLPASLLGEARNELLEVFVLTAATAGR